MEMASGFHGSERGQGRIQLRDKTGDKTVWVEYSYERHDSGEFGGSVSTWRHESDGAGLVAIMSRAMPTRAAVLEWIYSKAEKLVED